MFKVVTVIRHRTIIPSSYYTSYDVPCLLYACSRGILPYFSLFGWTPTSHPCEFSALARRLSSPLFFFAVQASEQNSGRETTFRPAFCCALSCSARLCLSAVAFPAHPAGLGRSRLPLLAVLVGALFCLAFPLLLSLVPPFVVGGPCPVSRRFRCGLGVGGGLIFPSRDKDFLYHKVLWIKKFLIEP